MKRQVRKNLIANIRTVHARGNASSQITDDSVLYITRDKKRALSWFQVCGISVPLEGSQFGLIRSVQYVDPKVKNETKVSGNKKRGDTALEKDKPKKYNKHSRYSETETLFMSWENGSAPVGERKSFYRFGKIHFYEKTETGCIELSRAQFNERTDFNVENIDRRAERGVSKTLGLNGSSQRGQIDNSDRNRDTGAAEAVSRQAIGEKLRDDAGRGVSSGRGVAVESETATKVSGKKKNRAINDSPLTRRSVNQRSVGSTHVNMSSTAAAEILGIANIAELDDSVKDV